MCLKRGISEIGIEIGKRAITLEQKFRIPFAAGYVEHSAHLVRLQAVPVTVENKYKAYLLKIDKVKITLSGKQTVNYRNRRCYYGVARHPFGQPPVIAVFADGKLYFQLFPLLVQNLLIGITLVGQLCTLARIGYLGKNGPCQVKPVVAFECKQMIA